MHHDELTIYSVRMADKPTRYKSLFALKEIVAGAVFLSNAEKQLLLKEKCLFDDDCSGSISHLNKWWGELTAIHYLIQTNTQPYIGNAHYRRYWDENHLRHLSADELGVAIPFQFNLSLRNQFKGGHAFKGVEITMHLAGLGRLPFTSEELEFVWNQNIFQGGPLAVGNFDCFKQLMTILFDCLWPIWAEYEDYIKSLEGYDARAIAFLSERFLTGILLYKEKFIPRIPLRHIPLCLTGS